MAVLCLDYSGCMVMMCLYVMSLKWEIRYMPLTSIQVLWVLTRLEINVDCALDLGELLACN